MTRARFYLIILLVFAGIPALWGCASNPTKIAGGTSTETVIGSIVGPDGSPAVGAVIYLRPKDYLPDIMAKVAARFSFKTLDSTVTDSLGGFEFNGIAPGTYMLECIDPESKTGAVIDSVVIENPDSTKELATDTLKPLGAISGQIQLPESLDASQVRVMVYGLDRAVEPDSFGQYSIPGLAEGVYVLRIQSTSGKGMDLKKASVASGDTTWVPSSAMPGEYRAYASRAAGSITLDGVLDESDWAAASVIRFSNPAISENQVVVRTLWDSVNFYIAYVVTDTLISVDPDTQDDASQDDGAEIYLDPNHDAGTAMNGDDMYLLANVINESKALRNEQYLASTVSNKTHKSATGYNMEIAIPWTLIGKTPSAGLIMGILYANNDKDGAIRYQFDWLGLTPVNFKKPNLWGDLVLLP